MLNKIRVLAAVSASLSACAPLEIVHVRPGVPSGLHSQGALIFGTPRFEYLSQGEAQAYTFQGLRSAFITIGMTAVTKKTPDSLISLYASNDGRLGQLLARDDDGGGSLDSLIAHFEVPATGEYTVIAESFHRLGSGDFVLELDCVEGVCESATGTLAQKP